MNNAPCKDCTERHIRCHSECEKYIAFHEARQKELERVNKEKQTFFGGLADSIQRMKTRRYGHYRKEKK